jgi:hypothetical protein
MPSLLPVAPRRRPPNLARISHCDDLQMDTDLWRLRCEATDFVDDGWPPWIRVRLLDADGREWLFEDKIPIFGDADHINAETVLPTTVSMCCRVLADRGGGVVDVEIDRARPEALDGTTRFRVRRDQLTQ